MNSIEQIQFIDQKDKQTYVGLINEYIKSTDNREKEIKTTALVNFN